MDKQDNALPVVFSGEGRDYFGIWVVNLLLTVLTLGIYSAWAKVRRMHFFYRHTSLAGAAFDYHGEPLSILKGRTLAFLMFMAYQISAETQPMVAAIVLLVLMAVMHSFTAFPVDQNFLQALRELRMHELGADLFASAFWIALPVVAMLMFANLALGIVSRVAPQMNIFAIGFPITLSVGLIGVAVTLPMLEHPFSALMQRMLDMFAR